MVDLNGREAGNGGYSQGKPTAYRDSSTRRDAIFQPKQFSNKLLSRQSGVARCAILNFKKGQNTIKSHTLRKLTKAIHDLQTRT